VTLLDAVGVQLAPANAAGMHATRAAGRRHLSVSGNAAALGSGKMIAWRNALEFSETDRFVFFA